MSYWQYSSDTTRTDRRYSFRHSVGMALVVALHVGVIIALQRGLNIGDLITPTPPLNIHVVEPPIIKLPVELLNTKIVFTGPATIRQEVPTFTTEKNEPIAPKQSTTDTANTPQVGGDTVILQAKIDPHHPLTQPQYPLQSRRLAEQGTVELLVHVLPNGRVNEARIALSSGFARLDEAAQREALRAWQFIPNTVDGVAMASWNRIAITFRLKN